MYLVEACGEESSVVGPSVHGQAVILVLAHTQQQLHTKHTTDNAQGSEHMDYQGRLVMVLQFVKQVVALPVCVSALRVVCLPCLSWCWVLCALCALCVCFGFVCVYVGFRYLSVGGEVEVCDGVGVEAPQQRQGLGARRVPHHDHRTHTHSTLTTTHRPE